MAGAVGTALGVAGATYQGLFRNPLADPYLIGVAQGAALGAVVGFILPCSKLSIVVFPTPLPPIIPIMFPDSTLKFIFRSPLSEFLNRNSISCPSKNIFSGNFLETNFL